MRHPKRRATVVGLALFVSVLAVPRPVETQSGSRRLPGFEVTQEWIQLARSHRPGETDAAVMTAIAKGAVDRDGRPLSSVLGEVNYDLGSVRALIRAILAGRSEVQARNGFLKMADLVPLLGLSDRTDGFPDRKTLSDPDSSQWRAIAEAMIAVAVLQTDVAMTPPDLWDKYQPRTALDVVDGRTSAGLDLRFHYLIARTAVDVALPSTRGGTFGRLWYRATAAHLQNSRNYLALVPHLEHARIELPEDARMFLFGGAAFENLAAPSVQAVFRESAGTINLAYPPELLLKAEPLLRRALELDPASAEGRVRLGRVLYLRGQDKDAYPMLTRAETDAETKTTKYYASLFAGRVAERMADEANARVAYERASALFPEAQSPRMALAEVDLRSGDQEAARLHLRTLFRKPDILATPDPWWTYDVWLAQDAPDLIARMRAIRASAIK